MTQAAPFRHVRRVCASSTRVHVGAQEQDTVAYVSSTEPQPQVLPSPLAFGKAVDMTELRNRHRIREQQECRGRSAALALLEQETKTSSAVYTRAFDKAAAAES